MKSQRFLLSFLVSVLCQARCTSAQASSKIPSEVMELNDRFLDVRNEGLWFVELYAPWCGHCKRLAPVWEQVGHELAEEAPDIRVAKLDCTRFTSVASTLDVHGFPTIKLFRHGVEYTYEGDRSKKALVSFALKAKGPEVREFAATQKSFQENHNKYHSDVYFLLVATRNDGEVGLKKDFYSVARKLFTQSYFFETERVALTKNISITQFPVVLCFKDGAYFEYEMSEENSESALEMWVKGEMWPSFPEINYGNLYDIGLCCDKLLVLAVIRLVDRKKLDTDVGKFGELVERLARRRPTELAGRFQFGWTDGDELASGIALGNMRPPALLVWRAATNHFYLADDAAAEMTEQSLVLFLQAVASGERQPLGGRGYVQRIKRMLYEFITTVYNMFATQPLLTCCLFGLPLGILSVICYSLCTADFSVDREEVYPEDEDDDTDVEHEKRE